MRNLLAFLGAALVVFLGLGWYLDWYKIQSTPQSGGHRSINIDLNTKKIGEDVNNGLTKGEQKLKEVLKKDSSSEQDAVEQEAETLPRDQGSKKDPSSDLRFSWPSPTAPNSGAQKKNP